MVEPQVVLAAFAVLAMGAAAAGNPSAEADWSMTLSLVLGLVSFIGGVLCLGGAFLIRTHLRESRQQSDNPWLNP